ncbi:hypothetical protein PG987_009617 [Apiospora arundinis]
MATTKYSDRSIPKISLENFDSRIDEITQELVAAAETDGFFVIVDHGISSEEIEAQFENAARFFALPDEVKATVPFSRRNVRPSTGVPDQKESYQMQYGANMEGMWLPEATLAGFREQSLQFMHKVQAVSERLMVCFARGLGFPDRYFVEYHDVTKPNIQTVLRLLHYFALDPTQVVPVDYYRAGAHADWDLLTLLFQRPGQSGLEICPGREVFTAFGLGDVWTKVEPGPAGSSEISTFHRVKTPSDPAADYFGPRYSMAYFNQPNTDCQIQGPLKKYPLVTGSQFTEAAMKRNYSALEAKKAAVELEGSK